MIGVAPGKARPNTELSLLHRRLGVPTQATVEVLWSAYEEKRGEAMHILHDSAFPDDPILTSPLLWLVCMPLAVCIETTRRVRLAVEERRARRSPAGAADGSAAAWH